VYRFLLSPRWIGLALLMTLAGAAMVGLGVWQLDRYHLRSEINASIDAASAAPPTPLAQLLAPPAPAGPGRVGPAPPASAGWARVSVAGRYDPSHEILVRARTVNGRVGFEVITPLILGDGNAVLVDRGWVPPDPAGAAAPPKVPPTPPGDVTVVGRVHGPESRATAPEAVDGRLAVRRVAPDRLAEALPYPLYGAYVTLESQTPPADPAFVAIPPVHENAAMNAGYVVQWWIFATLTLAGFGFLIVREARTRATPTAGPPASGASAREPSAREGASRRRELAEAPISPAL
jgi:cytochrome oxidase assembly protein ShyY1